MGSQVTVLWASLLSIFNFLCPFVLDLGSGTGQTDRQTAVNALCPTLWERAHNND